MAENDLRLTLSKIINQVRKCDWNTFKHHELVTLEICLLDAIEHQPTLKHLYNTLANDTTFVKPARKRHYLTRSKEEKLHEKEKLHLIAELKPKITILDDNIEQLIKLKNLIDHPSKAHLENLLDLLDKEEIRYRVTKRKLILNVNAINNSFNYASNIKNATGCVKLVLESDIVKSINATGQSYNKLIEDLALSSLKTDSCSSSLILETVYKKLKVFICLLTLTLKRLAMIYKYYAFIFPHELQHRRNSTIIIQHLHQPLLDTPQNKDTQLNNLPYNKQNNTHAETRDAYDLKDLQDMLDLPTEDETINYQELKHKWVNLKKRTLSL